VCNVISGPQTSEDPIKIRPKLSAQAEREARRDSRLRRARTCYGHLAGVAGVALMDKMISLGWLEEDPLPATGNRVGYNLSIIGHKAMADCGVEVATAAKTTSKFAFCCLDWKERRQHLGGALGRAATFFLSEHGFVGQSPGTREVTLKGSPEVWLDGAGAQG